MFKDFFSRLFSPQKLDATSLQILKCQRGAEEGYVIKSNLGYYCYPNFSYDSRLEKGIIFDDAERARIEIDTILKRSHKWELV